MEQFSTTEIIIAFIGCNGLWAVVLYLFQTRGAMRTLMRAVSYHLLSDTLKLWIDTGYAPPEARQDVEHLYKAYKANGWNGDMDARIEQFYDMPMKKGG